MALVKFLIVSKILLIHSKSSFTCTGIVKVNKSKEQLKDPLHLLM